MDTIHELQLLRADLIREIDDKIGKIILDLKEAKRQTEYMEDTQLDNVDIYESAYPLRAGTGIFKGKRPIGIIFADGTRKNVITWKNVFKEIMEDCNKDKEMHKRLMDLREKLSGRKRVFLSSVDDNMRSPVKIDRALYGETHYDAETLLRIMTNRILDVVGYDYSNIQIVIENR